MAKTFDVVSPRSSSQTTSENHVKLRPSHEHEQILSNLSELGQTASNNVGPRARSDE